MNAGFFADCFSGAGGVARKLRLRGGLAREWDIALDPETDLCAHRTRRRLKHEIRQGRCCGLMLAPPCGSWTTARDRAHPIRSRACPLGLPDLDAKDQEKVEIGNRTANAAIDLAEVAHACRCVWVLEQPHTSKMWQHPRMLRLRRRSFVQEVVTDFCMWGKPWRKRTRFLVGHADPADLDKLARRCHGRGLCQRTGRPHVILTGSERGIRRTLLAMPYPEELCHVLASILIDNARPSHPGRHRARGHTSSPRSCTPMATGRQGQSWEDWFAQASA